MTLRTRTGSRKNSDMIIYYGEEAEVENIIIRSHYVYCDFNINVAAWQEIQEGEAETENYCNDCERQWWPN